MFKILGILKYSSLISSSLFSIIIRFTHCVSIASKQIEPFSTINSSGIKGKHS
jgi:hypothetical protein